MAASAQTQSEIAVAGMIVRPQACEVAFRGERILLEPQVMRMLAVVAINAGEVVSRDQLVEQCWDGRSVSEDAINRVVSRIRKLAVETGAFELQTQRKVGYRLVPQVLEGEQTAAASTSRHGKSKMRWFVPFCLVALALLVMGVWKLLAARPQADRTVAVQLVPSSARDSAAAVAFTADLRQSLARVHGLRLVNGALPDKADLLIDGAFDQASARPSILLTLKSTQSGETIWSGRFARSATLLPERQRAIAAVVRYMAVWLSDEPGGGRTAREPERADVVRLVTEGAHAWQLAGEERQRQHTQAANRLYALASSRADAALAINPQSAKALMLRYQADQIPDFPRPGESQAQFESRRRRADQTLTYALAADPDDPAVLVAAAQDFYRSTNWNDAGALLRRAIALDPRSADANSWYAYHLALLGRCNEGLRYARAAVSLDPSSSWRQRGIPRLLQCAGNHRSALSHYRALLRHDPANASLAREAYLTALSTRDPAELESVAALVATEARTSPQSGVALIARIRAATSALRGTHRS